ncbi:MAG: hypothetical protein R6U28_03280 [Cyclonatronaceae bacterium]
MLRILLIIVISYIVIRIALRMLLTGPSYRRRSRMYGSHDGHPFQRSDGRGKGPGRTSPTGPGRFDHIEDAEFEEINDPEDAPKNTSRKDRSPKNN